MVSGNRNVFNISYCTAYHYYLMLLLGSHGYCSGHLNDGSISSGEQIRKLQHLQSALGTILVIILEL